MSGADILIDKSLVWTSFILSLLVDDHPSIVSLCLILHILFDLLWLLLRAFHGLSCLILVFAMLALFLLNDDYGTFYLLLCCLWFFGIFFHFRYFLHFLSNFLNFLRFGYFFHLLLNWLNWCLNNLRYLFGNLNLYWRLYCSWLHGFSSFALRGFLLLEVFNESRLWVNSIISTELNKVLYLDLK